MPTPRHLLLSIAIALGGLASFVPTLASAAEYHHHRGHQVCHYDHHHHRQCHWVH